MDLHRMIIELQYQLFTMPFWAAALTAAGMAATLAYGGWLLYEVFLVVRSVLLDWADLVLWELHQRKVRKAQRDEAVQWLRGSDPGTRGAGWGENG